MRRCDVPRADKRSRSEVEQRSNAVEVDPALIDTLAQGAAALTGITIDDRAEKVKRFTDELISTIRHYRQRIIADEQERPARFVAALEAGLNPATSVLAWLDELPVDMLIELRAGDIQTTLKVLISRIKDRVDYWEPKVKAHRPAGKRAARRDLRWSLIDII